MAYNVTSNAKVLCVSIIDAIATTGRVKAATLDFMEHIVVQSAPTV